MDEHMSQAWAAHYKRARVEEPALAWELNWDAKIVSVIAVFNGVAHYGAAKLTEETPEGLQVAIDLAAARLDNRRTLAAHAPYLVEHYTL